jgi:serine/threonine-protein kinase
VLNNVFHWNQAYDVWVEGYGLRCTAYWLLTGRQVFSAPNTVALLMQHTTATPEPPSTHNSSVPRNLDEIVLSCLEKKPENRVSSVVELGQQLAAAPFAEFWGEHETNAWWKVHVAEVHPGGCESQIGQISQTLDAQTDPTRKP